MKVSACLQGWLERGRAGAGAGFFAGQAEGRAPRPGRDRVRPQTHSNSKPNANQTPAKTTTNATFDNQNATNAPTTRNAVLVQVVVQRNLRAGAVHAAWYGPRLNPLTLTLNLLSVSYLPRY